MRVLHFYKSSYPESTGGVEQVIHQIAKGTSKLDVQVAILSLTTEKTGRNIEVEGYQIHLSKQNFQCSSTGFSVSAIRKFAQLAEKADLIHYHFPWPFMDMVHFICQVRKPALLTYHSDIIRQKFLLRCYRPLQRQFLSSVDHIVATSPNYMVSSKVLDQFADKVSIIPIGLDKNSYQLPTRDCLNFWRTKFGERFFLFIGVLRYYKGLFILLEAAKKLSYPIVIAGSGPLEKELKKKAAKAGISNIHFLGYISNEDKAALIELCYVVVFPSHLRSEAFGVFLLEGAMYGKPMISSEIGTGTTFINIHGETGLSIPPDNPDALEKAMVYLWDNPAIVSKMGESAKNRYWKHFTAEKMSRNYLALYSSLLK